MKLSFTCLLMLFAGFLIAQTVADFEEYNLLPESFLNGEDGSGGFSSGDIFLPNNYTAEWMTWSGWAISNTTDVTTPGYLNQYSAIAGGGFDGSAHYAVTYAYGNNNIILQGDAAGQPVSGLYITNSTYAYLSMLDGDAISKKFGGITGNDPDYFLLTIKAYFNGNLSSDSVNFYLADYRYSNNSQDYIIDEWTWVGLSSLGAVDSLTFTLTSSDVGQFGINTPTYFCIDNIISTNPNTATSTLSTPGLFEICPNPTTELIQISHSENEILDCLIFDFKGNLMHRQKMKQGGGLVCMQSLPSGNYVVRLQGKLFLSSQVVVKH